MDVTDNEEVIPHSKGEFGAALGKFAFIKAVVKGVIWKSSDGREMTLGVGVEGVYIPLFAAEIGVGANGDGCKDNRYDGCDLGSEVEPIHRQRSAKRQRVTNLRALADNVRNDERIKS